MNKKENKLIRIQMDEIMKTLFNLSKRPIIDFLNSAYKERFSYESEVSFTSEEFVSKNIETDKYYVLRGDGIISVKDGDKIGDFHIEFQTINDDEMIARLFKYGFLKADKELKKEINGEIYTEINMPTPYVIMLEGNKNVKDTMKLKINIGNKSIEYESQVLKYWEYDAERLYNENMYLLLSLQVFKIRYKMNLIKRNSNKTEEEKEVILKEIYKDLKRISEETIRVLEKVDKEGKLTAGDIVNMLDIYADILEYLDKKYRINNDVKEEVKQMVRVLYDPKIEQKGIEKERSQTILKQYKKGLTIEYIADINEFDIEYVKNIVDGYEASLTSSHKGVRPLE